MNEMFERAVKEFAPRQTGLDISAGYSGTDYYITLCDLTTAHRSKAFWTVRISQQEVDACGRDIEALQTLIENYLYPINKVLRSGIERGKKVGASDVLAGISAVATAVMRARNTPRCFARSRRSATAHRGLVTWTPRNARNRQRNGWRK